MKNVVAIRFKKAGKLYYFDPLSLDIDIGNKIIVESENGLEFATVVGKKQLSEKDLDSDLKPVLRIASKEDIETNTININDAKLAMEECKTIIAKHGLEMKLIDTEYTFDKSKLTFYFLADGRVDFRNLVKELASVFRTRIELRQVGVRDEAKLINSLGHCGKKTCCSSWAGEFAPVSIKMAKEQSLSLNPTKISGVCGRLLCCLKYEYDHYVETNKKLPNYGEVVHAPCGKSLTINASPIKEEVSVRAIKSFNKEENRYELDDSLETFKLSEIKRNNSRQDKE